MRKSRLVSQFLCIVILLIAGLNVSCADESGYPAAKIDPSTGAVYDLGGKTVYIYDYYTVYNWSEQEPSSDSEIATYNYRKWIESTYNCKVIQTLKGDWGTCADEMISFAQNPDGRWCVFIIEPGKTSKILSSNVAAAWNSSNTINLDDDKWNQCTIDLNSYKGKSYGVSAGRSEPTICLYFNKKILSEAGIDWNNLYDMQKAGTWTWNQFEKLLQKVHGDIDNDGIFDFYGLIGSKDDLLRGAVFSNGGTFFDYDASGELTVTSSDVKTKTALNWASSIWNEYARKQRSSENWDYYKDVWKGGNVAFYIYRAYGGFSPYSEMSDMKDEWGCVAFPKGNDGGKYVSIISDNTTFIPNVYTSHELDMITLIYDLWTSPTPGIVEDYLSQYEGLTDDRAIYETYAMLSSSESYVNDKTTLLGTVNDMLGLNLLWKIGTNDLDEILQDAEENWNSSVDQFNSDMNAYEDVIIPSKETLNLPDDLKAIGDYAFEGIDAVIIRIPSGCRSIGKMAFANNPRLATVYIPKTIVYVADDAFEGSNPTIIWE